MRNQLYASIVIPVYNTKKKYLTECFDSCAIQTYANTEVVIVDDGSDKETADFCDEYASKEDNWLVIHKKNSGLNDARKSGFDASRGRWVAFVDSDDMVAPGFIEKLLKSCCENKTEAAIGEALEFFDNDTVYDRRTDNPDLLAQVSEFDNYKIAKYGLMGFPGMRIYQNIVCGKLYARKLLNRIDWSASNYWINEDEFFSPQVHVLVKGISFVQEQLYFYRRGVDGTLSTTIKQNSINGRAVSHIGYAYELYVNNKNLFHRYDINADGLLVERYLYMIKRRVRELIQIDQLSDEIRSELLGQYAIMHEKIKDDHQKKAFGLLCKRPDIKASLVIPVFNTKKSYLIECFDSVKDQSYWNTEVIIVDDGSETRTSAYCDKYTEGFSNWKVIHQKNSGAAAARNSGMDLASGDYVQFVDADDFFDQSMVEKLVVCAEDKKSNVTFCRYNAIDAVSGDGVYLEPVVKLPSCRVKDMKDEIFSVTVPAIWNKLFRTDFINKNDIRFDSSLVRGEDLLFVFKALSLAERICVVDEYLYHYRANVPTSVMHSNAAKNSTTLRALKLLKKFLEEKGIYDKFKKSFTRRAFDIILYDYADWGETFRGQYTDIREFLLSLDETIYCQRRHFRGAHSGYWSYDDVIAVINSNSPAEFYANKIARLVDQVSEQQKYIDELERANHDLQEKDVRFEPLGVKDSSRHLIKAARRRISR